MAYTKPRMRIEEGHSASDPLVRADMALTKRVAAVIERYYPGHPWLIEASHAQGVVMISIPLFMGRHKWVVHINTLKTDPAMKAVMRAAGEILERYRIPRQSFSRDEFLDVLHTIPPQLRARRGVIPA